MRVGLSCEGSILNTGNPLRIDSYDLFDAAGGALGGSMLVERHSNDRSVGCPPEKMVWKEDAELRRRRFGAWMGFEPAMRRFTCVLILTAAVGGMSCSSKKPTPFKQVTGIVTYKGETVKGAIVSLAPKGGNGRSATGTTDANGAFKLGTGSLGDGALPGEYEVTIRKSESENSPHTQMTDMDEQKQAAKGPLPIPKVQELLPAKYGKAATSGLTAKVGESGAKDLKFELVD